VAKEERAAGRRKKRTRIKTVKTGHTVTAVRYIDFSKGVNHRNINSWKSGGRRHPELSPGGHHSRKPPAAKTSTAQLVTWATTSSGRKIKTGRPMSCQCTHSAGAMTKPRSDSAWPIHVSSHTFGYGHKAERDPSCRRSSKGPNWKSKTTPRR